MLFFFSSLHRKPRRKPDVTTQSGKEPSPPPNDLPNSSLINSTENANLSSSTSLPTVPSAPSHSLLSTTNQGLVYLRPEYAVFTRSLAECNIHDLIRQPTGVDKNEWIANNSSYHLSIEKPINTMFVFLSCLV